MKEVINIFPDGACVCATYSDFINLQESPAGYGDTIKEAVLDLFKNSPERCGGE